LRKQRLRRGLNAEKKPDLTNDAASFSAFLASISSPKNFQILLETRQNSLETPPYVGYNRETRRRGGGLTVSVKLFLGKR
jgi:hypothetical protein